MKCLVYIDLNMVRASVVGHPSEWAFSGFNEIQQPKRKKILINYERLRDLLGIDTYDGLKVSHRGWVESSLETGSFARDGKWTQSIAVGNKPFIQNVKSLMGGMAIGRKQVDGAGSHQLRDFQAPYIAHFKDKKSDIGLQNAYFWS